MMPNLDGISATRNIRQYDTWTPIISMTANTTDRDVREYIMSGMTDVLPKPLDQRMLCKLLERYCAHLRRIQQRPSSSSPRICELPDLPLPVTDQEEQEAETYFPEPVPQQTTMCPLPENTTHVNMPISSSSYMIPGHPPAKKFKDSWH